MAAEKSPSAAKRECKEEVSIHSAEMRYWPTSTYMIDVVAPFSICSTASIECCIAARSAGIVAPIRPLCRVNLGGSSHGGHCVTDGAHKGGLLMMRVMC